MCIRKKALRHSNESIELIVIRINTREMKHFYLFIFFTSLAINFHWSFYWVGHFRFAWARTCFFSKFLFDLFLEWFSEPYKIVLVSLYCDITFSNRIVQLNMYIVWCSNTICMSLCVKHFTWETSKNKCYYPAHTYLHQLRAEKKTKLKRKTRKSD